MKYVAGLDLALEEWPVCIVDESGEIEREFRVASEPQGLIAVLRKLVLLLE